MFIQAGAVSTLTNQADADAKALALVSLLASLDLISRQTAGRPDDAPEITADEIRAQVVPATLFRSSRAAIMALITELVKLHSANEHALKREGPRAN